MNPAIAFGQQEPFRPVTLRRRKPRVRDPDELELDFGEPVDAMCDRLLRRLPPRPLDERDPPPLTPPQPE